MSTEKLPEWPAWVVLCDDRYRRANDPYDAFASEHFGPWRPSLNIEGGMYLHRDAARAWQAFRDWCGSDAIRALEASRDLITHERNDLLLRLDADGIRDMEAELAYIRADRDRLAGEVERQVRQLEIAHVTEQQVPILYEEIARLTSELAAAKINAGNFAVIDAGQPISAAVPTYEAMAAELAAARENEARWLWMFPDDALVSVTERMQRVYRKWDGSDSWNAAVDAARRAGGEG